MKKTLKNYFVVEINSSSLTDLLSSCFIRQKFFRLLIQFYDRHDTWFSHYFHFNFKLELRWTQFRLFKQESSETILNFSIAASMFDGVMSTRVRRANFNCGKLSKEIFSRERLRGEQMRTLRAHVAGSTNRSHGYCLRLRLRLHELLGWRRAAFQCFHSLAHNSSFCRALSCLSKVTAARNRHPIKL